MDLNNVVMEIISEAEKKAKEIGERAKIDRERILSDVNEKLAEKKGQIKKETEEKITQERTKSMAVARLQAKKIEMDGKREALENLYVEFAEKIYTQGKKEIMNKLFNSAKGNIDAAKIYVSADDMKIAKDLFKNVSIEEADIVGGIIIENKSKTEKLDLSLETLIENLKKETVADVSKILFGGKE